MALDVNTIATDAHLADEVGSERLTKLQPKVADRDARRAKALEDVLEALKGRSPPIYWNTLSDPTELKSAVVYRTLWLLCRDARAVAGDTWDILAADFEREYGRAIKRSYSVSTGVRGPSGHSLSLERR